MADRILVVEDEEAISELIEMNLTVAGYEVVQVYDGGKVEEVLEQEAGFDLALVDVMLPGRDGFSLMEVMKHFRIPVIYRFIFACSFASSPYNVSAFQLWFVGVRTAL